MDYTSLIGPAVVAAGISGLVSVIGIWISARTTKAVHGERLAFEREQAERRVNAEIALAERKFSLDRKLGDHKRRVELAGRTLIAFYQARDVFTWVRSRGIFGDEGNSRQLSVAETEDQKKQRNTYFIPIERLTREKSYSPSFSLSAIHLRLTLALPLASPSKLSGRRTIVLPLRQSC
jgi:hypothetical protein